MSLHQEVVNDVKGLLLARKCEKDVAVAVPQHKKGLAKLHDKQEEVQLI